MTTTDQFPWETAAIPPSEEAQALREGVLRAQSLQEAVDEAGLGKPTAVDDVGPMLQALAGDPGALSQFTADARVRIAAVIRGRAEERKAGRPEKVTDQADLRPEMVGAADDAEVLDRLGAVFVDVSKIAKGIAGDLVAELPVKRGKPVRTVRMGDGHGSELTINTAQPTEAYAELDDIIDVVATATIGGHGALPTANPVVEYAAGVREGIAAVLEVLAAPKVKTTALDALATKLEGRDEDALAKRLRGLYGRRDKGEPTVKIDRKPLAEDDS